MSTLPRLLGVLAGLVAGLLAASVLERRAAAYVPPAYPEQGPLLAECAGALDDLVIHYVPSAAAVCVPVYREFLRQLPSDVRVHVLTPTTADYADLVARLGPVRCQLLPVTTNHPLTCWSRDRWLALPAVQPGKPTVLLTSREELGSELWPERAGDQQAAADLAAALPGRVQARRSSLAFDAGDFITDGETVFVSAQVTERNPGISRDTLIREFRALTRLPVVLLDAGPRHHAAMFMMLPGNRTALVGDPALARRLLADAAPVPLAAPDWSATTQAAFDSVAAACRDAGYRVTRIPVVPDADGRTYLTYVNVILDQPAGRPCVYLPSFRDAETLNAAAAAVWRELGFEVHPVDCTSSYRRFGNLHCLVNVLSRRPLST